MSRVYSDNRRPVEAFGSDFSSMGVYPTVADAAAGNLTYYMHVSTCCRCAAPYAACRDCSLFKRNEMTFRWADDAR